MAKTAQAVKTAKVVKGAQSQKTSKVRLTSRFRSRKIVNIKPARTLTTNKAVENFQAGVRYTTTNKQPKRDKYTLIKYPLTTESAMKKIEEINTLVFLVDARATKSQIRRAVQELYDVKIAKVNTLIRPDCQKKAFVKLTSDYDALDVANRIGII